ncbi:MAG: YihY/virulence factor BrkB family protein [Chloroflexota bacterium]
MGPRDLFSLLRRTVQKWSQDKASRLAAALAYYTIFSVAPLLVIIVLIVGLVLGPEAARGQLATQLEGVVGADTARTLQGWVDAAGQQRSGGIVATVFGLGALLLGALGLFGAMQGALDTVWASEPQSGGGVVGAIRTQLFNRLQSFAVVLSIGALLLVSFVASTVIGAIASTFGDRLPGASYVWFLVNIIVSFAVVTLLFAVLFKVLPNADVKWGDVWGGAALTALLFVIGKELIGLYLSRAGVGSIYGAAGSLVVVLVWVYYAAQILLLGAEFTHVYAHTYGSRVVPEPKAAQAEAGQAARPSAGTEAAQSGKAEQAPRQGPVVRVVGSSVPVIFGISLGFLLGRRRTQ